MHDLLRPHFLLVSILATALSSHPIRSETMRFGQEPTVSPDAPAVSPVAQPLGKAAMDELAKAAVFEVFVDYGNPFERVTPGFFIGTNGIAVMSLDVWPRSKRVKARINDRKVNVSLCDMLPGEDIAIVRVHVEAITPFLQLGTPSQTPDSLDMSFIDAWTISLRPSTVRAAATGLAIKNVDLIHPQPVVDGDSSPAEGSLVTGAVQSVLAGTPIVDDRGAIIGRWGWPQPNTAADKCIQNGDFVPLLGAKLNQLEDECAIETPAGAGISLIFPKLHPTSDVKPDATSRVNKLSKDCRCWKCDGIGYRETKQIKGDGRGVTTIIREDCRKLREDAADKFLEVADVLTRSPYEYRCSQLDRLTTELQKISETSRAEKDNLVQDLNNRTRSRLTECVPGTLIAFVLQYPVRIPVDRRVDWNEFRILLSDPCVATGGVRAPELILGVIAGRFWEQGRNCVVIERAVVVPFD